MTTKGFMNSPGLGGPARPAVCRVRRSICVGRVRPVLSSMAQFRDERTRTVRLPSNLGHIRAELEDPNHSSPRQLTHAA